MKPKFGTSFLVNIHHTENHSWQGSIQWLETGETIHFRSALEMTLLIDQAVQEGRIGANSTGLSDSQDRCRQWHQALKEAK